MNFTRLLALSVFAFAVLTPVARAAKPQKPAGVWKGYISIDAATGQTLAEENADVVTPPASMTKLMTFAVVYDKLQSGSLTLDTVVQITPDDAGMGGTQVFLDPSEAFPVEDLIHALMIQSANDAAHALARFSAGSVEAFVELMNAKARSLGMTNTTFRSPHGLPPSSRLTADGDLTTPRDFAILCRYLVQKTDVLKYSSVKERDFGSARVKGPMHMINHNKLLGQIQGVDGLKTGYTKSAGYCLSATALRNGHRVIIVIMGAFGPGGTIDLGAARDRKTIELLSQSFAAIPAGSPTFIGPKEAPTSPFSPVASPVGTTPAAAAPASTPAADAPMVKFTLPPKKK
ncbi:D-alanyl-D-alanine carboxypeptidase family protein [Rariglobus hedericola]|uniref:D-alanyl-D-alanine carboxypeptidase n=1 Tax=Rariglobus hedericola TaxID=2597822 RepID=A0A556QMH3_9BACT|nr:D-alanyl-D-alanine carboxypeptidase family protein [Rariglobus hedericola]TSJ77849.1 D-alanyl-D-alanine carboxypeptidase [Rariglobus hedericola]